MAAKNKNIFISVIVSAGFLWLYRDAIASAMLWFADQNAVAADIQEYGYWGPVVLFALFVLQVFFAFIPGQGLMLASANIYGFTGGFLISWISLAVGGQLAFWLARRYGRPFAEKWVSPSVLNRWDKSAAGRGIAFYVITLVMPFFPNDAMCYVAGIGRMSSPRFLIANILGRGIASFFTALVGAYSGENPALFWVAVVIFIVIGIIGLIVSRRYGQSSQ